MNVNNEGVHINDQSCQCNPTIGIVENEIIIYHNNIEDVDLSK